MIRKELSSDRSLFVRYPYILMVPNVIAVVRNVMVRLCAVYTTKMVDRDNPNRAAYMNRSSFIALTVIVGEILPRPLTRKKTIGANINTAATPLLVKNKFSNVGLLPTIKAVKQLMSKAIPIFLYTRYR
jgi:hypothetical protein